MNNSARDRLLVMMHPRSVSPTTDLNTYSEDGSDFSSGVVVCDLSNELRRYPLYMLYTHPSLILIRKKFRSATPTNFYIAPASRSPSISVSKPWSSAVHCEESNSSTAVSRLRVRRKHHGMSNGSATIQRTQVRSKPRIPLAALSHHRV